jgi:hypothetical protein
MVIEVIPDHLLSFGRGLSGLRALKAAERQLEFPDDNCTSLLAKWWWELPEGRAAVVRANGGELTTEIML